MMPTAKRVLVQQQERSGTKSATLFRRLFLMTARGRGFVISSHGTPPYEDKPELAPRGYVQISTVHGGLPVLTV